MNKLCFLYMYLWFYHVEYVYQYYGICINGEIRVLTTDQLVVRGLNITKSLSVQTHCHYFTTESIH